MRFFPNLVESCAQALCQIFAQGQAAEQVLEQLLASRPKWGSRDRQSVAETIFELVRHYRFYAYLAELPETGQGLDMPGAWRLLGFYYRHQGLVLPPFDEWQDLPQPSAQRLEEAEARFALRYSLPDWLDELGRESLGSTDWESIWAAMHRPADIILRNNSLKNSRQELIALLKAEDMEVEPLGEEQALRLLKRRKLQLCSAFREGRFEVQDYNSQAIAPLLQIQPGQFVVDACAGAGGKSLHLGALLQNKGQLLSLDVEQRKLRELDYRAQRAGLKIHRSRLVQADKPQVKDLYDKAERLLLDVPCSGLGVLRRQADTKWKLQAEDLHKLLKMQAQILKDYSPICKKGGLMLYATCSILPQENEGQIEKFLQSPEGQGFKLLEQHHFRPDSTGYDGFFAALLQRLV